MLSLLANLMCVVFKNIYADWFIFHLAPFQFWLILFFCWFTHFVINSPSFTLPACPNNCEKWWMSTFQNEEIKISKSRMPLMHNIFNLGPMQQLLWSWNHFHLIVFDCDDEHTICSWEKQILYSLSKMISIYIYTVANSALSCNDMA